MAVLSRTPSDMSCHSWNCHWKSSGRCAGRRKILGLPDFTKKNQDLTALKPQTRGLNQQKIWVFQTKMTYIISYMDLSKKHKGDLILFRTSANMDWTNGGSQHLGLRVSGAGFDGGIRSNRTQLLLFFGCKYDTKCQAQLSLVII